MVVAFDFDGVLSSPEIQALAKKMIREKNDVWVVTKRNESFNRDVIKVCDKIGIPPQKVIYTNNQFKAEYIMGINADLYVDNITEEFDLINSVTNCTCLLYI